jgi:hypothetical protein
VTKSTTDPKPLSPFERFTDLTRRIVAVPKSEVDAERRAETKAKARKG